MKSTSRSQDTLSTINTDLPLIYIVLFYQLLIILACLFLSVDYWFEDMQMRRDLIAVFCLPAFLREFLLYLQRYKSFFAALPEMMCEGETVVDGSTCWVGNDLAER